MLKNGWKVQQNAFTPPTLANPEMNQLTWMFGVFVESSNEIISSIEKQYY